jgi:hypothetical protein
MIRAALILGCAAGSLIALSGCESTVDAARKLAKQGEAAFQAKGISVGRVNREIKILHSTLLEDANGSAVVIEVRNASRDAVTGAPIALNVRDRSGHSIFENNDPGLEPALTHLPLLLPGEQFLWVNDQLQPNGTPASVIARIGSGTRPSSAPSAFPISGVSVVNDPTSGAEANGKVKNTLSVTQRHLVIYGVASRAGRVVAAGRAILTRLNAGKTAPFHIFFIGNPAGAQLFVSAPPSVP